MDKMIEAPFGNFYYGRISKPIRDKKDIVLLLLDTLNILEFGGQIVDEIGHIVIRIGKMSRVFYELNDKYFSIVFPFSIEKSNDAYTVHDTVLDVEIDNKMISLMRAAIEKVDFFNISIEAMLEYIYYEISDEGYTDKDVDNCYRMVLRLFTTELGYIRYDYDEIHQNGNLHPLNHLDINYSSKGSYKLGLKKRIEIEEFLDILDVQTECRYVI